MTLRQVAVVAVIYAVCLDRRPEDVTEESTYDASFVTSLMQLKARLPSTTATAENAGSSKIIHLSEDKLNEVLNKEFDADQKQLSDPSCIERLKRSRPSQEALDRVKVIMAMGSPVERRRALGCFLKSSVPLSLAIGNTSALGTYGSCAVVSNSGALLARPATQGAEIDRHNAVLRMNDAVISEKYSMVGQKETIRLLSSIALQRLQTEHRFKIQEGVKYIGGGTDLQAKIPPASFFSFSFDYYYALDQAFRALFPHDFDELHGSCESLPSMGAVAMLLALHTCDSVDAYDMVMSDASSISAHHYYNDVVTVSGNTSIAVPATTNTFHMTWEAEHDLWQLLSVLDASEAAQQGRSSYEGFSQLSC